MGCGIGVMWSVGVQYLLCGFGALYHIVLECATGGICGHEITRHRLDDTG